MKYLLKIPKYSLIFLFLLILSCNTGNRTDIQRLLSPAALPYLKNSKLIQVSSYDTSGGNQDFITLLPGRRAEILNAEGPGMISRIWLSVDSDDPFFLRRVVIRMFWDKEKKPSVEVPLGDFFGSGFRYKTYSSHLIGMTGGGYTCYLPMPFERHARIEIANETRQEIRALCYQIDYQKFEGALESDVAYFHALWNRKVLPGTDSCYIILNTEGKGHIVGLNMNIQSYDRSFEFMNNDELIYVDREKKPSIHGTNIEELFSGVREFTHGEFATPFSGLVYKDDSLGRISAYRWYIQDPIPFKKSIRFLIEYSRSAQTIADYSSTVYWYQMEPHKPFPSLPAAGLRIPLRFVKPVDMIEAEKLSFDLNGLHTVVEDMSAEGPDWGQAKQLVVKAGEKSSFGLTLSGLKEPDYTLVVYYTRGPTYGNADIVVNGEKAGEINGYCPYILPDGMTSIQGTALSLSVELTFRITGKNPGSKGYSIGLDGFSLKNRNVYIPEWYVLGPFPEAGTPDGTSKGLDIPYIGEQDEEIRPDKVYNTTSGKSIRWRIVKTDAQGLLSCTDQSIRDYPAIFYIMTYIWSPEKTKVILRFSSDEGMKILLNRKEVFRFSGAIPIRPDQAEVELNLEEGWNRLLLKTENRAGVQQLYARIIDLQKVIEINPDRKMNMKGK